MQRPDAAPERARESTPFTEAELVERRPIWEALSTLFLDTDISADLDYRVRVLSQSRFTIAQLESILGHEVYPVCVPNTWSFVGIWSGFDLDWLESEIVRRLRRPKVLRLLNLGGRTFHRSRDWLPTRQGIEAARAAGTGPTPR